MIIRRIGLVLAVLISLVALVPALDIGPDPATGQLGVTAVAAAVLTVLVAVVVVVLVVPAWRGSEWAGLAIGGALLAGIVTSFPVFFAPPEVVPAGGVIAAAVGTLVTIAVVAMVLVTSSSLALHALAVIVVIALYASVVSALLTVVPPQAERLVHVVTAVAVVLLYAPLLTLLRRTVGRALYGGRLDPAATAWLVGDRRGADTEVVASALTDAARELRLPRIELVAGDRILAVGVSPAPSGSVIVTLPLRTQPASAEGSAAPDDLSFRITLRVGERQLRRDDRTALQLVALPLSLLARESALLTEVRTARAALADVREREQLTLHRDLHDGLGPLLTGAVMRADAARNLLATDVEAARDSLDAARSDLRVAVTELRRVVYRLWPLELEQRGLWGAIATRAARSGADLVCPDTTVGLPPAVELALYRIVSEALTNADRHAPGETARVAVDVGRQAVTVTVTNPLPAGDPNLTAGMGRTSIGVRAEELGGYAEIGPTGAGRGNLWRVHAVLPAAA